MATTDGVVNNSASTALAATTAPAAVASPYQHAGQQLVDIPIKTSLAGCSTIPIATFATPSPTNPNSPSYGKIQYITQPMTGEVKFVQLVLETSSPGSRNSAKISNASVQNAIEKKVKIQKPVKKQKDESESREQSGSNSNSNSNSSSSSSSSSKTPNTSDPPEPIDATCTICGQHYKDRAGFNAHIKAHLKEKLNTRREQNNKNKDQNVKDKSKTDQSSKENTQTVVKKEFNNEASDGKVKTNKRKIIKDNLSENGETPSKTLCTTNADVMAELGACQPIPPSQIDSNYGKPFSTRPNLGAIPGLKAENVCTPEISDMEEDLMTYEMEMNRIDFNNDLSNILDQIEKDFESPGSLGLHDIKLDTPPDSDNENSEYLSNLLNNDALETPGISVSNDTNSMNLFPGTDLLGFDKFTRRFSIQDDAPNQISVPPKVLEGKDDLLEFDFMNSVDDKVDTKSVGDHDYTDADTKSQQMNTTLGQKSTSVMDKNESKAVIVNQASNNNTGVSLVQSPASLAKVGPLSPKALAVLNQLPTKVFVQKDGSKSRLVNVVKVERTSATNTAGINLPPGLNGHYTVINIECYQPGSNGDTKTKIIESYRAVDTGNELKLLMGGNTNSNSDTYQSSYSDKESSEERSIASSSDCGSMVGSPQKHRSLPKSKTCSECTICGKTITTKNMARHMEKHTGRKKFQCHVCQASFYQKTHMKNHILLHQNNDILQCAECPQKFFKKAEFQKHIKIHSTNDSLILKCDICQASFDDQVKLDHHRKGHLGENSESFVKSAVKSEDGFRCKYCDRFFTQKGHLNRHLKTHTRVEDLICKICDKQCKNRISLQRHRAKHLACVHCNKVFESKSSLQEHLLMQHQDKAIVTIEQPKRYPSPPIMGVNSIFTPRSNYDTESSTSPISSIDTTNSPLDLDTSLEQEANDIFMREVSLTEDRSALGFEEERPTLGLVDHLSPDKVGESLADISNTNFFDFDQDLSEELYPKDLF